MLQVGDAGKLFYCTNTTPITISAPDYAFYSNAAFAPGANIDIVRAGTGGVTIAPHNAATVNGVPGLKLRAQFSAASLVMVTNSTWILAGDLAE